MKINNQTIAASRIYMIFWLIFWSYFVSILGDSISINRPKCKPISIQRARCRSQLYILMDMCQISFMRIHFHIPYFEWKKLVFRCGLICDWLNQCLFIKIPTGLAQLLSVMTALTLLPDLEEHTLLTKFWLFWVITGFPPYLENLENLDFCNLFFQAWNMPRMWSKSEKKLEF